MISITNDRKGIIMNTDRRLFFTNIIKGASLAAGVGLLGGSAVYAKGGRGGKRRKEETATTITTSQKEMLFYIFQEAKVARDVYITLGELYPDENTFAMIQLAEQRHIDAAGRLCEKYGIDTSIVDLSYSNVGIFEVPELQQLHDTLVTQGRIDLLEALYVGREIEITDIDDIEAAQEGMPSDVIRVFNNLLKGSRNHLAAFERAIERAKA